jgi:hypothetical protein
MQKKDAVQAATHLAAKLPTDQGQAVLQQFGLIQ